MEKIRLLLYCCKQPHKLFNTDKGFVLSDFELGDAFKDKTLLNGKIVSECEFRVEALKRDKIGIRYAGIEDGEWLNEAYYEYKSCLGEGELFNYIKVNDKFYAIHIKNLKERVMELSDVCKYDTSYDNMFGWIAEENEKYIPLDKAPQNMCRVWIYENGKWVMYILISVRPEWLVKILNGEKTIEIRRKVLKEMVK